MRQQTRQKSKNKQNRGYHTFATGNEEKYIFSVTEQKILPMIKISVPVSCLI
jgi:hypothetical protein